MKKEIAKIWCEALRSGEYEQCEDQLRHNDSYCCLGVLCELAIKNGVPLKVETDAYDVCNYNEEWQVLPKEVMDWAGMRSADGTMDTHDPLINLNDSGYTFHEIADVIEEGVEEL